MLGHSSGNHDCLLANAIACVSCGFHLRNARNASDCVWMETGLEAACALHNLAVRDRDDSELSLMDEDDIDRDDVTAQDTAASVTATSSALRKTQTGRNCQSVVTDEMTASLLLL